MKQLLVAEGSNNEIINIPSFITKPLHEKKVMDDLEMKLWILLRH